MAEELFIDQSAAKEEIYMQIIPQIKALTFGESDRIANLANIAAVLKEAFNFLWVGFYIFKNNELVLGPFQGPLACTRIAIGKGVCGTSAANKETIIVPNVDDFPGHIFCSSHSKSEIVVPILKNDELLAVLDVDSERLANFDDLDQEYLNEIAVHIQNIW